jgi:hypothetical protein
VRVFLRRLHQGLVVVFAEMLQEEVETPR